MMKKIVLALCLFLFGFLPIYGQLLTFQLDSAKGTYIKANLRGQAWFRFGELNPGSEIAGQQLDHIKDFSIRRYRATVQSQIAPRVFIYAIVGQNNINAANKEVSPALLDLTVEYTFHRAFELGVGQSSWGGPSRWSVRSSSTLMALDAPLFSLFTVNKNDILGRLPGIFAKGKISKFDYVVSIQKPYNYHEKASEYAFYARGEEKLRSSYYLKYEITGNESNQSAYSGGKGTYLGRGDIFNIGTGLVYQPDMMATVIDDKLKSHDFLVWSIESFYDRPLSFFKKSALTSYLGYFYSDFGPGYIRNLGANDIATGGSCFNGSGMDFPMMGTGTTLFGQLGIYKQLGEQENKGIQPNVAIQYSSFNRLADPVLVYDLGVNFYLDGKAQKISLGWQSRPEFEIIEDKVSLFDRKSCLVLQYQFILK